MRKVLTSILMPPVVSLGKQIIFKHFLCPWNNIRKKRYVAYDMNWPWPNLKYVVHVHTHKLKQTTNVSDPHYRCSKPFSQNTQEEEVMVLPYLFVTTEENHGKRFQNNMRPIR